MALKYRASDVKYRVHISDKAEADVDGVLAWFQTQSATKASERWFAALWKCIDTLEASPERCPLTDEAEDVGLEIRQLLFGRSRVKYRILFEVRGNTVHILRVWHSARDALRGEDL
jgi:plasmid stabilization system protein ParE